MEKSVATARQGATFLSKAYLLLAQIKHGMGRMDEALRWCRDGKVRFPKDPELWFEEGLLHKAKKDLPAAQRCFEEILMGYGVGVT